MENITQSSTTSSSAVPPVMSLGRSQTTQTSDEKVFPVDHPVANQQVSKHTNEQKAVSQKHCRSTNTRDENGRSADVPKERDNVPFIQYTNWRLTLQLSRCDERSSHPQILGEPPKYWMEDWRSRWNGLGRYGERQWTWDVTGAHDAMNW